MVIKAFDNELFFSANEKVYALEEIPKHEHKSRNFDFETVVKKPKKKRYIPSMNHPWKQASFERFKKRQAHRNSITA